MKLATRRGCISSYCGPFGLNLHRNVVYRTLSKVCFRTYMHIIRHPPAGPHFRAPANPPPMYSYVPPLSNAQNGGERGREFRERYGGRPVALVRVWGSRNALQARIGPHLKVPKQPKMA